MCIRRPTTGSGSSRRLSIALNPTENPLRSVRPRGRPQHFPAGAKMDDMANASPISAISAVPQGTCRQELRRPPLVLDVPGESPVVIAFPEGCKSLRDLPVEKLIRDQLLQSTPRGARNERSLLRTLAGHLAELLASQESWVGPDGLDLLGLRPFQTVIETIRLYDVACQAAVCLRDGVPLGFLDDDAQAIASMVVVQIKEVFGEPVAGDAAVRAATASTAEVRSADIATLVSDILWGKPPSWHYRCLQQECHDLKLDRQTVEGVLHGQIPRDARTADLLIPMLLYVGKLLKWQAFDELERYHEPEPRVPAKAGESEIEEARMMEARRVIAILQITRKLAEIRSQRKCSLSALAPGAPHVGGLSGCTAPASAIRGSGG